ncbi:DUF5615 family PIN-like protein [Sphingomonas sp. RHCKR7]|uniref:DUF5615 family PIN-like protein n=1 Tax=Sphingomonas folli TaxID=2862497 RepID=UPI001CA5244D|nr:DUF5615 family PIN-like protein [Sphingomonas folli]MBW6527203.1 DUF5615 family PIN-like protein [Sphingomonas folli]
MIFLVDAQLPPRLCDFLRVRDHIAHHVSDQGLAAAPDAVIAREAERIQAVLVTKDEDFRYLRLPDRFALLWLRVGNASNRGLVAWLTPRWPMIDQALAAGERLVEVR